MAGYTSLDNKYQILGVANMSGVIKKNVCYIILEKKMRLAFYPNGRYAPCYHITVVIQED